MKKIIAIIIALSLSAGLAACSAKKPDGENGEVPGSGENTAVSTEDGMESVAEGIIVNGGGSETVVVAAGSAGLLSVSLEGTQITYEGESCSFDKLKNGMSVEIVYDVILETYPGMVSPATLKAERSQTVYNDITGLYAEVIKTLWEEDSGLNSWGENVYLDLTCAPGLGDSLKEALVWLTGCITGKSVSAASWDELEEQGIFDRSKLLINDGCYIAIKGEAVNENKITFTAQKYVGGDGAIFFNNCVGEWNENREWTFTPGGFAIA